MIVLLFLLIVWILPILLCANICQKRNRSIAKGVFLSFCFGWFAVIGMWLALRRRNRETLMLY